MTAILPNFNQRMEAKIQKNGSEILPWFYSF
ncbi:hypothetical protein FIC_00778 [Flavobacteriaceae bacterium 3519-10]|nr:hypothetical protein FIC_00778 [Flavobacteriaceae bacterium 3519-10]